MERMEQGIYQLKPMYLTTDFNFEMIASTVTNGEHEFFVTGNFRTKKDLAGVRWESEDNQSHTHLKYPKKSDFSGVILRYNYEISGDTNAMDLSNNNPSLTIETEDNQVYYIRLWNYVVDRPLDYWEQKTSEYLKQEIRFPKNRVEGNGTGLKGTIELNFDELYSGWTPYVWESKQDGVDSEGNPHYIDTWVPDKNWVKVSPTSIKKIMWTFTPQSYVAGVDTPLVGGNHAFKVTFSDWSVYTSEFLMKQEPESYPDHAIRLCDDFDDIYNLTPERVVYEYRKLGYCGILDFYIGASHYYDKAWNGEKFELITEKPFNIAFESWYTDYMKRLKECEIQVIHSISMESVDAPDSWKQRTADGEYGHTLWKPMPYLLSFTNQEMRQFYKKYVLKLCEISAAVEMQPIIQLGESWWWFNETDGKKPPCFYDDATCELYRQENGNKELPIFHSIEDAFEEEDRSALLWLRKKNGEFSLFLRDVVKEYYANALFTVLFFPPSVLDSTRVTEMVSIVNFPVQQWKSPNLDFFMLEDYDYLIENDKMHMHMGTMNLVQTVLDYPPEKIHYLCGFVLKNDEDAPRIWRNIDQSINDGFNYHFQEVYIWAYPQVKRDGWIPPNIIYANVHSKYYQKPFSLTLSLAKGVSGSIYYTVDGSEPTEANGIHYTNSIAIGQPCIVKALAVDSSGRENHLYSKEFQYLDNNIPISIKQFEKPEVFPVPALSESHCMEYNLNTNCAWIYCNYPEFIAESNMLWESNHHYLHREQITSKNTVQVFYSYYNKMEHSIWYGIRLRNPNPDPITVTIESFGTSTGEEKSLTDANCAQWIDFFKGAGTCEKSIFTLNSQESEWIISKTQHSGSKNQNDGAFSGNFRMNVTGEFEFTFYCGKNSDVRTEIEAYKGEEQPCPHEGDPHDNSPANPLKKYRGKRNGYFLQAEKTFLVSELLSEKGQHFRTHFRPVNPPSSEDVKIVGANGETDFYTNTDLLPIDLIKQDYKKNDDSKQIEKADARNDPPYHNIGNWGIQYYFTITIKNDIGCKFKLDGYILSEAIAYMVLSSGGDTKYAQLSELENPKPDSDLPKYANSWYWLQEKLEMMELGDEITMKYQFILATNGSINIHHIFKAKKIES